MSVETLSSKTSSTSPRSRSKSRSRIRRNSNHSVPPETTTIETYKKIIEHQKQQLEYQKIQINYLRDGFPVFQPFDLVTYHGISMTQNASAVILTQKRFQKPNPNTTSHVFAYGDKSEQKTFKTTDIDKLKLNNQLESVAKFYLKNMLFGLQHDYLIFNRTNVLKNSDLMEKRKIEDHKVGALIGQFGLFAKQKIFTGTVIGAYVGVYCLQHEWQDKYCGTVEETERWRYLQTVTTISGEVVIVDPVGSGLTKWNPMCFINDGRHDIDTLGLNHEDKRTSNVTFEEYFVDGIPIVFITATKQIHPNTEVFSFFGNHFSHANHCVYYIEERDNAKKKLLGKLREEQERKMMT